MTVGLIKGRHNLPHDVDAYIWDEYTIEDVTDVYRLEDHARRWVQTHKPHDLTVYVTGLTVCTVAVINACHEAKVPLFLMHYNRAAKRYFLQVVK